MCMIQENMGCICYSLGILLLETLGHREPMVRIRRPCHRYQITSSLLKDPRYSISIYTFLFTDIQTMPPGEQSRFKFWCCHFISCVTFKFEPHPSLKQVPASKVMIRIKRHNMFQNKFWLTSSSSTYWMPISPGYQIYQRQSKLSFRMDSLQQLDSKLKKTD